MRKWLTGAAAACLISCGPSPNASAPAEAESFSFIVIGDTPYDAKDQAVLDKAVPIIRDGAYPFIIHIGDYKGGGTPCLPIYDQAQADLIDALSPIPVFYTPGDNEWTDCDRKKVGDPAVLPSEKDRLDRIRSLFFSGQQPKAHGASFQPALPENQRWQYQDVQFATLHVVATNNGRSQVLNPADLSWAKHAVSARDAANLVWLDETIEAAKTSDARAVVLAMQADVTDLYVSKDKPETSQIPDLPCEGGVSEKYLTCDAFTELRAAIRDAALSFEGPVILIHGDSSPFTLNQEFSGEEAPNLWRLNAAGDAGQNGLNRWGTRDVTLVTIDPASEVPLSAQGLLTQKKPKAK